MKLKTLQLTLLTIILLIASVSFVHAQGGPGGPGDPGVDPGGSGNTNAPIDGGLALLIAAAAGYSAKKMHDKRKNAKTATGNK